MASPEVAAITLPEVIRIAISRTGLTLAQVGEALDVHEKTVGRWQRGVNTPDFGHVVQLASMARMPLSTFAEAVVPSTSCLGGHLRLVPPMDGQMVFDLADRRRSVTARPLDRRHVRAVR
jgi:transcriptional regulator with XRE-family HTH domain